MDHPEAFSEWLDRTLRRELPHCVVATSEASLCCLLKDAARFPSDVQLPYIGYEKFLEITNKAQLTEIASSLKICTPTTIALTADAFDETILHDFPFPAVLKPQASLHLSDGRFRKPQLHYVASPTEVMRALGERTCSGVPYILQEEVKGEGIGVFALVARGRPLLHFCHQRILEKPPSGGVSVLCESIPSASAPLEDALKLLSHLEFHGVAMVEFKRDAGGRCYLLEVNPRFWGSLQLAVDCGRDFPGLFLELAACRTEAEVQQLAKRCTALPPYLVGERLRWERGTLDHAFIRMKNERFSALAGFFAHDRLELFSGHRTRWEVLRWQDMRPFWAELRT